MVFRLSRFFVPQAECLQLKPTVIAWENLRFKLARLGCLRGILACHTLRSTGRNLLHCSARAYIINLPFFSAILCVYSCLEGSCPSMTKSIIRGVQRTRPSRHRPHLWSGVPLTAMTIVLAAFVGLPGCDKPPTWSELVNGKKKEEPTPSEGGGDAGAAGRAGGATQGAGKAQEVAAGSDR
jgi:hypothetical protein